MAIQCSTMHWPVSSRGNRSKALSVLSLQSGLQEFCPIWTGLPTVVRMSPVAPEAANPGLDLCNFWTALSVILSCPSRQQSISPLKLAQLSVYTCSGSSYVPPANTLSLTLPIGLTCPLCLQTRILLYWAGQHLPSVVGVGHSYSHQDIQLQLETSLPLLCRD